MNFDQYLSILVPLSVFVLVFWTKRIILPLCVGIVLGAFVVKSSSPLEIPIYIFEKLLSVFYYVDQGKRELNTHAIYIFVFLMILGILPQMFFYSGGIEAFVSWARKKVKDRRSSEFLIFIAGIVIFIDDQFNALTLGRSVRPLGDASKISRERLAYIIDSTSAPVCILIPLSSWGAYIIGILNGSLPQEGSQSALVTLISSIGLNFYAWFALLAVFLTILWRVNLPVMHCNVNVGIEKMQEVAPCGRMSSLIFPIVALAFGTLAMIFLTGYLNSKSSDIVTILNQAQTGFSIFFGGVLALVVSFLTSKGKIAEEDYYLIFKQGIKISLPSVVILILAWAIGTIVRDDLQTGIYLSDFAKELLGNKSLVLIPLLLFIASIFIAFMTGTSWGCFAVMIPIGVDLSLSLGGDVSLALAAVLSGAIFGDHTSPISDTTILSSAGTGCSVQSHFITQLPYASIAAFSAFVSLLVLGIFDSVLLAFVVGGGMLVGIFYFLKTRYSQELQIV
ncbi:Na+/H+ antiporter NhaC family protein [Helicobacter kayseriensis]|uniref:Na+/H+ antiporter NhaC family protein n=1 Tax=Helicobacter kayseriensis TaxID=2905877 RepID=UPI001E4E33E3|nr:Na+/H+ antiporter NhaC family protein [Helicobacter kayseriensis]MCE3047558.1 Na+/H+ antiporter NhaC family protein [Helicobacter kayseriensis]MCE3048880.1 Na+/H+ antiporter NhaC family protein [Helicobacter kayseriensis]